MKKHLVVSAIAVLAALRVSAALITFDDLPFSGIIPNGYAGLNWNNFDYLTGSTMGGGYVPGTISPPIVAYNLFGHAAAISDSTTFTLDSAYLTAAWRDNLQVEVIGSLGATIIYDDTYTLSATTPTLINFNPAEVNSVEFISSGGTSIYPGQEETQFVMDNLTINAPVPDPPRLIYGALLLLPVGMSTLRMLRKRQAA